MNRIKHPTPPYTECRRPIETAPREGYIWVERRPRPKAKRPLLRPIARARWIAHRDGQTGHWVFPTEPGTYTGDENIIGWEPVDEH